MSTKLTYTGVCLEVRVYLCFASHALRLFGVFLPHLEVFLMEVCPTSPIAMRRLFAVLTREKLTCMADGSGVVPFLKSNMQACPSPPHLAYRSGVVRFCVFL